MQLKFVHEGRRQSLTLTTPDSFLASTSPVSADRPEMPSPHPHKKRAWHVRTAFKGVARVFPWGGGGDCFYRELFTSSRQTGTYQWVLYWGRTEKSPGRRSLQHHTDKTKTVLVSKTSFSYALSIRTEPSYWWSDADFQQCFHKSCVLVLEHQIGQVFTSRTFEMLMNIRSCL